MANYIINTWFIPDKDQYINSSLDATTKKIIRNENDFYYWIDAHSGYSCFIKRIFRSGHLCGYVEIPKNNIFFGKSYNEIHEIDKNITVHGGLTFSEPLFSDAWCLGFDCHHSNDLAPFLDIYQEAETYRTVEYVTQQCEQLAKGLHEGQEFMKTYISYDRENKHQG